MAVERPAGFDNHLHRALVLLAGSPTGMRVSDATTSDAIAAPSASYLQHFGLVHFTGDAGERVAHITSLGRELIRLLHDERDALA